LSYKSAAQDTDPIDFGQGAQSIGGNTINWREQLAELHERSFAWALFCCRRRVDEAEEVLQVVYTRILGGRAHFDGRASAKTWLFAVIRHTAREHGRRRWLRSRLLERWLSLEPESAPALNPEQLLQLSQDNASLRRALDRLPRRQQEILHLVFYQDLTIEESARMLDVSLGTARTHFERGKRSLRESLQPGAS
jgi:RNA polymerase sigma-70 factor, ECF subfamily